MKFRPRTQSVEAHQWDGAPDTMAFLREWMGYAFVTGYAEVNDWVARRLLIENRSGRVNVNLGDWIVRDDDGFYPMEPILFRHAFVRDED